MKIAIVYKSATGNTKALAEEIKKELKDDVIYFGEPKNNVKADLYFVGSWTFKGDAVSEIKEFLHGLENSKIAYFTTCGFGGSQEYFKKLCKRAKENIDDTNNVLGIFCCQGKMPMSVREKYVNLIKEHPEDKNLKVSIKNFDEALDHPNNEDFTNLKNWVKMIIEKAK